jgi:streptogramin lyase
MHGNGRGGVLKYYPPGSIYRTVDGNFDPNVSWGGTWELLKDVFLVGAGNKYSIGSTGGSADAVVLAHTHGIRYATPMSSQGTGYYGLQTYEGYAAEPVHTQSNGVWINDSGTDGAGKNMPPYKAVNTWVRTS